PFRQPRRQRDMRDVRGANQQVRRELAQATEHAVWISKQRQYTQMPQRVRLPGQRAGLRIVLPVAFVVALIAQAEPADRMSQPSELERDLVQACVSVGNDVLAHVLSFAEKGNAHPIRPLAVPAERRL